MRFTKELFFFWFFILLLFVLRVKCKIKNQIGVLSTENELPDDVVKIISHCYFKNENIVLSGDWSSNEIKTINKISDSVILFYTIGLKEDKHFQKHQRLKNVYKMSERVIRKKKYPGNTFIIMINNMNNLLESLSILKNSLLWNHEGDFLIINKYKQNGCHNAHSILELVWSYRILSVILLCFDEYSSTKIYTFNPYTNFAPKFWSMSCQNKSHGNSRTLYYRLLDSSLKNLYKEVICQNLFFDKTINLGGYSIKAGAYIHPRFLPYDKTKSGLERFGGLSGQISSIIWNHLNATVHVDNYSKSQLVDDNTLPQYFLRDLLKGKIEITLNINLLRDFWKLQTYPQESAEFCITSRKYAPSINLNDVVLFQPNWLIVYCLIYICLLSSLKYVTKKSYSFAFLESIRTIAGLRILFQPTNFGCRTVLINFMFIIMLIRILFYTYLTSFNVVPDDSLGLETDEDLIRSNLNIYGSLDYEEHLRDLDIKHRYRFGAYADCIDRLANGQQLICLAICHESRFAAHETETLHISKAIRRIFLSFSTSEDWPLLSRFNQILRSLSEVGLITYIMRKESYLFVHRYDSNSVPKFSLANIKIIWYIWLSGVILATVVFFIETLVQKIKISKIHVFDKS